MMHCILSSRHNEGSVQENWLKPSVIVDLVEGLLGCFGIDFSLLCCMLGSLACKEDALNEVLALATLS